NSARLRQASNNGAIANLPIAIVYARDRSGAHHTLQLEAPEPGDLADRLLKRDLHLGQRRYRRPQGQFLVEYMILPYITVNEHVIAELLRVSEAGAMSHHQPGMRPEHRNMVGDGTGVGRAGADVDQCDSPTARFDEMKRRHLRHALRANP